MFSFNTSYQRIAILLTGISLLAPMLYSSVFYGERLLHRMEMWYEASHGELETIELDPAKIIWTKKNRELIINDAYFDVVEMKPGKDGKITVRGVFDHEETEMHEAYHKSRNEEESGNHTTQKLADWLQTLWFFSDSAYSKPICSDAQKTTTGYTENLFPDGMTPPPVPPPRQFSCI
ncbi:MAG: hypothetical protein MUE99_02565 [Chitinophagaceae bacterium]|jgi:hypothetical protein|nr:hypothetical protein [Chitinophagaceae bacterium]